MTVGDRGETEDRRITRNKHSLSQFGSNGKKENQMNKEHVKGAADKAKGAIKEVVGKVTGDKELQTEGKLDKVKGALHDAVGDAKDALKE